MTQSSAVLDEPREASGRDTEIGAAAETTGSPLAERKVSVGTLSYLPLDGIDPDPDQPRLAVDTDLADSIRAQGILQPILVRPHPSDAHRYMLVDGERRWRGAAAAGLETIPVRVRNDLGDAGDVLLQQLALNEGKRLAPLEEAKAWRRIMEAKHWNIANLAGELGRSKSTVSDRLAMLDAPAAFQPLFSAGVLTAAAAPIIRPLAELPEPIVQQFLERARQDYRWNQAEHAGTPLSLTVVKSAIERALTYPFEPIEKRHADYAGETFEFRQSRYATDRNAYSAFVQKKAEAAAKAEGKAAAKPERDYAAERAAEDRNRRQRVERTRALRTAQFQAIVAKLPPALDDRWAMLLVEFAVKEMQQLNRSIACKALGIPLNSKTAGHIGSAAEKALIAHAAKLNGVNAKIKLLMQALLATSLQVSEWGPNTAERLTAAAKIARVDLKKVKVPDQAKANSAKAAKKSPAKKSTTRTPKRGH